MLLLVRARSAIHVFHVRLWVCVEYGAHYLCHTRRWFVLCFVHIECKHFDWFQTINNSDYRFTFQLCAKWLHHYYAFTSERVNFFLASLSSVSFKKYIVLYYTCITLWVLLLIILWNAIDTHKYSFYSDFDDVEMKFGIVCVTNCLIDTLMRTFTRVVFNWKSFNPTCSSQKATKISLKTL